MRSLRHPAAPVRDKMSSWDNDIEVEPNCSWEDFDAPFPLSCAAGAVRHGDDVDAHGKRCRPSHSACSNCSPIMLPAVLRIVPFPDFGERLGGPVGAYDPEHSEAAQGINRGDAARCPAAALRRHQNAAARGPRIAGSSGWRVRGRLATASNRAWTRCLMDGPLFVAGASLEHVIATPCIGKDTRKEKEACRSRV
jgi:hypothetical protein